MNLTIKNDKITAEISTANGEIVSLKGIDGHEYFWSGDAWKFHAPLLFPICGRVKDYKYSYKGKTYEMKQHGFTRGSDFELISHTAYEVTLALKESCETLAVYPFRFLLTVNYRIFENTIEARFTVRNNTDEELPFMIGWHPAFVLDEKLDLSSYSVQFKPDTALCLRPLTPHNFMESYSVPFPITDGIYRLNKADILNYRTLAFECNSGYAKLCSDSSKHSVSLEWSENVPYFCIWKMPEDDVNFICLEPWSGLPADGAKDEDFKTKPDMCRLAPNAEQAFIFRATFD